MTAPLTPRPERVELTRRTFLAGAGASAVAGLALPSIFPRYAFATPQDPGTGDVLVVVFLRGGADGLSMVVPHSDQAGYGQLRGPVAIPPPLAGDGSDGTCIDLSSGPHPHELGGHTFGFHPAMAGSAGDGGLKAVWDQGHLAVVHSVGFADSSSTSRSHFDAQDHWERATGDPSQTTGWLARHLGNVGGGTVDGLAWGPTTQESLRGHLSVASASSLAGLGIGGFTDAERAKLALGGMYPGGAGDPTVAQGRVALDVVQTFTDANPLQHELEDSPYPEGNPLAAGLEQIAMVIRADVGLRVACIDMGGWDLHNAMGTSTEGPMRDRVATFADAMHAFHADLAADGTLDEVTVLALSEFGRTINANGSGGTDHGRGNALYLMGNHVVPGLHGDYPSGPLTDGPVGDLTVGTDFRAVLAELLVKRLDDANLGQVLPGYAHLGDVGVLT